MTSTTGTGVSQMDENVANNNMRSGPVPVCLETDVSPSVETQDANMVKVITTIPPENSYPKSLFPFTPIRLLPMSRFADVGRAYQWLELKEKVCVSHPL